MGFLFGNKEESISTTEPRINALKYEQSTFGAVKSVVYGTNRICGNIIDTVDFTPIAHTTTTAQSGKGGQQSSNTSYTYKARVAIGLCYGEIQGIKKVLLDDGKYSLSDFGLNLFKGTDSQAAWGEMQTYHPERALKYRNLAYVAGYIDLTSNGGIPQFNFEVNALFTANTDDSTPVITEGFSYSTEEGVLGACSGTIDYSSYYTSDSNVEVIYHDPDGTEKTISNFKNYSRSGSTYTFNLGGLNAVSAQIYITYNSSVRLDANPKDIVQDILTNEIYGANFPSEYIDDLTNFSDFCIANNVFLSPVYDAQSQAQACLTDIVNIANASFIWTQGKLKLIPLGDEEVTGNGKTWTPDLTPVYDLTVADFIGDEEPVTCTRSQQSDVNNSVKIEFLNRANDYNVEIAEAQDLANIELHGLRPADTITAHQICTAEVAQRTVHLALDRAIAVRNKYQFKLPMKFILLDALDIVTLTYAPLGLDREPVRILTIKEADGELEFEAEELVIGTATPAKIQHQRSSGEKIDYAQKIGNINPLVVFEPPFELTQETLEVWIGGSSQEKMYGGGEVWISDDGETYKKVGELTTQIRQGVLSTLIDSSDTEIDKINKLKVDLSMSKAELLSGSQADADKLNTLCYCDGELLAYQNSTLVDDYKYELSYLNRGAYSSVISIHDKGKQFCRIDEANFLKIPFKKDDIGKKIAVKITTFNTFGAGYQSLAEVQPYYYTIQGTALKQAPEDVTGLISCYTDGLSVATWNPVDDTRNVLYELRKGDSWEKGQCLGRIAANKFTINGNGTYFVKAFIPDYGVYSESAASIEIDGARLVQNVIATIDEEPEGWPGIKSRSVIINDYGLLSLSGRGYFSEISVFSEVNNFLYLGGLETLGTYEASEVVDIGAAASCYIYVDYKFMGEDPFNTFSKIEKFSAIQSLLGDYGGFILGSKIQIAIAGDNNIFGEWQDFIAGQYYGKKFKFRAVLSSSAGNVVVKMAQFKINVDVPDIVETGNAVVIPSEGATITFEKNFHDVPNVQITILNKEQGDDEFLSNVTENSFDIIIKNNGVAVEKTINYVIQGY